MTDNGEQRDPSAAISHESALADTFVMLADTLVDDYDVVDLLQRLTESCVDLLGASAAGLLLVDQRGGLAVVASSSEETRLLEVFQLQKNQGPCLDCIETAAAVVIADLGQEAARWPLFVPAAAEAGYHAVVAVPMRLRSETVGGLNLFYGEPQQPPASDQRLAQALADVATIGILQQRLTHRSVVLAEQLQHALNSRVTIEQAKGMLAERSNVEMDAAFARIRRHARDHNLKLTDVAMAVIKGDINPADS
jgi:GAF domain-containing protein